MRMKEMVEYLEKQDFDVKMEWNRRTRLYDFEITRYGITVTDNFQYPVFVEDWAREGEQKVFMTNIIRKWHAKAESNKNKKGESKMKDNDNLMYALAQTTAGSFEIMGKKYPVTVKDVTVDGRIGEKSTTLLTLEVDGRYGDPNDKFYPKYPNNDMKTVARVFDTLDLNQKRAVYELVGRAIGDNKPRYRHIYASSIPEIEDVIFNPPATIVFWADNTKTVVKCQEGDDFDPEKGLVMAIAKKVYGNKGNYCEEIKKWVNKYKPEPVELRTSFSFGNFVFNHLANGNITITAVAEENKEPEKRWKIWWKCYDANGEHRGSGVHCTDYACKYSATRAAHRMFDGRSDVKWIVSQDNPWEKD